MNTLVLILGVWISPSHITFMYDHKHTKECVVHFTGDMYNKTYFPTSCSSLHKMIKDVQS